MSKLCERVPMMMISKLPQFEYEKNVEIDEVEEEEKEVKTPKEIKPFDHKTEVNLWDRLLDFSFV
jgi:hypothetical protein